jgi:hypothetical protein
MNSPARAPNQPHRTSIKTSGIEISLVEVLDESNGLRTLVCHAYRF